MVSALSSALRGMEAAETQVNQAAARIAELPAHTGASATAKAQITDSVSLSTSAISMLESEKSHAANAKVIHAADEMQQQLLNVFG